MQRIKTSSLRSIKDADAFRGKRVLVRSSLNVPLRDGEVLDTFRIDRAFKTLRFLRKAGARIVVIAHIGRDSSATLKPVHTYMEKHMPVLWAGGITGSDVKEEVETLADGEVLLLENIRSDPREESNDEEFARELSLFGDIYVNDAFADAHRNHTSIVGLPTLLPSYAGLLFMEEYEMLSRAFEPVHPAFCIFGGAKFQTKLPLVSRFVDEYDHIFVGGAIAHDFLKACGIEIGMSKVSDTDLSDSTLLRNEKILLPTDVVVEKDGVASEKKVDAVSPEELIQDAGSETLRALKVHVDEAKIVVWNGPLGNYEHGYEKGTQELARIIAAAPGVSIIGGGDTVAAIHTLGLTDSFDFISTAGGAMLQFLEHETLPGIEAMSARISGAPRQ